MKITKAKLKQIIREEIEEAYRTHPRDIESLGNLGTQLDADRAPHEPEVAEDPNKVTLANLLDVLKQNITREELIQKILSDLKSRI